MSSSDIPYWKNVHTLMFDFDGIFTDNKVWVDQNGIETVSCDRRDGLAFDLLRSFARLQNWELKCIILSKEKNSVVDVRARKLGLECVKGVSNKASFIKQYLDSRLITCYNKDQILVYLGNDLNDLGAIEISDFSCAPFDSHPRIIEAVDLVLPESGGNAFVRTFIEKLICIHDLTNAQIDQLLSKS